MAQESAPAFLFYVRDFLTDARVAAMTLEARGAYITLLSFAWIEGGIPADLAARADLLKLPPAKCAKLWTQLESCFVADAGGRRLVNPRLEHERREQRRREAARRRLEDIRVQRARAGAAARWGKTG